MTQRIEYNLAAATAGTTAGVDSHRRSGTTSEAYNAWLHFTSRHKMFNQRAMLNEFGGPDEHPPDFHSHFRSYDKPPSQQITTAFWGKSVFEFMTQQLRHKFSSRNWGDLTPATKSFSGSAWVAAVVMCGDYSGAGLKDQQARPYERSERSNWWPLLVSIQTPRPTSAPVIGGYCQALAAMNSQAWLTHPSRVAIFTNDGRPVHLDPHLLNDMRSPSASPTGYNVPMPAAEYHPGLPQASGYHIPPPCQETQHYIIGTPRASPHTMGSMTPPLSPGSTTPPLSPSSAASLAWWENWGGLRPAPPGATSEVTDDASDSSCWGNQCGQGGSWDHWFTPQSWYSSHGQGSSDSDSDYTDTEFTAIDYENMDYYEMTEEEYKRWLRERGRRRYAHPNACSSTEPFRGRLARLDDMD